MVGFVSHLEKQLVTAEATAFVRDKVIPLAAELFGAPTWIVNPKEDQKPEEIVRQYAIVLSPYCEDSVLNACRNLFRYKNVKTFPTPNQIRSQLKPEDLKQIEQAKNLVVGRNIEIEYMNRDIKLNRNTHCLLNDYTRAVSYIIDELLPDKIGYSEYQNIRKNYSAKVGLAMKNNLFDDFDSILLQVYNRYHGVALPMDDLAVAAGF